MMMFKVVYAMVALCACLVVASPIAKRNNDEEFMLLTTVQTLLVHKGTPKPQTVTKTKTITEVSTLVVTVTAPCNPTTIESTISATTAVSATETTSAATDTATTATTVTITSPTTSGTNTQPTSTTHHDQQLVNELEFEHISFGARVQALARGRPCQPSVVVPGSGPSDALDLTSPSPPLPGI
ncbi:hypothetical protein CTheo_7087 [Ceratobasidium theobromae]|uniref:Transmembrane protein n=1 Tax=Ceratobasidium theobromae TaxID=1582974 RepID=A0A5N5QCT4_9AGAM|nr:hypothetical protein CTheo_7087 [Ceratobasidium theobromae]